jgi:hypothetical protein
MDIFGLHNRKIGEMSIIGFVAMGSILLKDFFFSLEVSEIMLIFACVFERVQTYLLNCLVNHHLKLKSKMHIDGANPLGRRLFRIICRFVVNRQGVWSTCAFYL